MKTRKLQYLGHITRGQRYEMLRLIRQEKIKGRRSIGKRFSGFRNIREWFTRSSIELFRIAADKVTIPMMISNIR